MRLRKLGVKCATVQLTIKDEYLRTIQRQRTKTPATDIGREIADLACAIFRDEWSAGKPVRMLSVTACNLVRADLACEQIDIFGEDDDVARKKAKKREETVDKIRQKYGKGSIITGAVIESDIGIYNSDKPRS